MAQPGFSKRNDLRRDRDEQTSDRLPGRARNSTPLINRFDRSKETGISSNSRAHQLAEENRLEQFGSTDPVASLGDIWVPPEEEEGIVPSNHRTDYKKARPFIGVGFFFATPLSHQFITILPRPMLKTGVISGI